METARIILERGGAVGIFPEGTRVRPGPLGDPKRGVGRLALETGAPVVPVAITGTEDIRRGWRIRPRKVRVRCGRALTFPRPVDGHVTPHLAREVDVASMVLRPASVGVARWRGADSHRRGRRRRQLGHRRRRAARRRGGLGAARVPHARSRRRQACAGRGNERYLPGVPLPDAVDVAPLDELDLAGVESGLPCRSLSIARRCHRAAPRPPARRRRCPAADEGSGGADRRASLRPRLAHAGQALAGAARRPGARDRGCRGEAGLVVASADPVLAARLSRVFRSAGHDCERTDDVVGVQLAGCAKNAAALAAGLALERGVNAAGAAAGRVYGECYALAEALDARDHSFAGLAGAGDLVATVLAAHSRNRRAGELLAARCQRRGGGARARPDVRGARAGAAAGPRDAAAPDQGAGHRRAGSAGRSPGRDPAAAAPLAETRERVRVA